MKHFGVFLVNGAGGCFFVNRQVFYLEVVSESL